MFKTQQEKNERNCKRKREPTTERKRNEVRDARAIAQCESGTRWACSDTMSNTVVAQWTHSATRS